MPDLQRAIDAMDRACRVWSVGYDQSQRQDVWDGGEADCSSLVIWALRQGGFDVGPASYTGNLSAALTKRGWRRIPADLSTARPGDILLNDSHHVCMVIAGYGRSATIAQASIDERGRASGGRSGDQTGYETNEKRIYTYRHGWDCILRWQGPGVAAKKPKTDSTKGDEEDVREILEPRKNGKALGFQALLENGSLTILTKGAQSALLAKDGVKTKVVTDEEWATYCEIYPTRSAKK